MQEQKVPICLNMTQLTVMMLGGEYPLSQDCLGATKCHKPDDFWAADKIFSLTRGYQLKVRVLVD